MEYRWVWHAFLVAVCVYVCMLVCLYVCMCVCVYVCMYVCMCVCACMYVHVCMCVCMYVCMHVCVYVCVCICMTTVHNYASLEYTCIIMEWRPPLYIYVTCFMWSHQESYPYHIVICLWLHLGSLHTKMNEIMAPLHVAILTVYKELPKCEIIFSI